MTRSAEAIYSDVAKLAYRYAWLARRGYVNRQAAIGMAESAHSMMAVVADHGRDVRWLRRYTLGVLRSLR